ncbi:MAG: D-Ala-D-Ala carboxypeptidase family metallohydrolase [Jaaginema sp. PMC 1079.18]|nr:D-Ala-D-Ala carboxypeptidase family metallohydrolase [Jaaginema sp. PMC 1080.18]MEC4852292.1 D-Ala-D-Ala carboxypeptidase family metallohydrolase [Jaaginema sp. PMC 1079.18]MEC4868500.1 D-Ala-D-Ala carboxypeptidase family metallohydrolase [Jaaginema sp. PMC 1078.18]
MATLTPDQRNYYYLLEAERTGIHKPILAALHQAHRSPDLGNSEMGLGVVATGTILPEQIDTFPEQVQYAANIARSLTDYLIAQGWSGEDIWDIAAGRYTRSFIERAAKGYQLPAGSAIAARLQETDAPVLWQAYLTDIETDYIGTQLPQNLGYLDRALLSLIERLPQYYLGLEHQRQSVLEAVRIWRKLDTIEQAIASIARDAQIAPENLAETQLDTLLKQFIQRLSPYFGGYPHQREALLRLAQLWRELPSREAAIASLEKDTSPDPGLKIYDSVLVDFVERVPQYYSGVGSQRSALTETVRLWRGLDSRAAVLNSFGLDPEILTANSNPELVREIATALDRELVAFIRRIPGAYKPTDAQREALIRLVQLWRNLPTRNRAIEFLTEDLKRLEREKAQQKAVTIITPKRPARWTPSNIILSMSIIPDGSFTWAEATKGGTRMPPNQTTVDAMIRIARLGQQARDRIGRPFIITSWYRPPSINRAVGGAKYSRHITGDAIDFVVEGLSGNQIYWTLDPWWPGGLGRYRSFPNLGHIDARNYRARWLN